jgi:hypothetical protein
MSDYKVGDPVTVYASVRGDSGGQPGEIVKVGRTLVRIRYGRQEQAFRMDTQQSNDKQYGYGTYFRTEEQAHEADRESEATTLLREHGIELTLGSRLTLEQVEALAEVVRSWED